MPRRNIVPAPLFAKLTDVWFATPLVMATRLSRMAMAGPRPSASDKAEMQLMGREKVMAFSQSWLAMCMAWWLTPLRMVPALTHSLGGGRRSQARLRHAATRASADVLTAGLRPVHRTVVANAKRLSRQGSPARR